MKKNPIQKLFKTLTWSCLMSILIGTFLFAQEEKAQSPKLTPPKKECPEDKASTPKPDLSHPSSPSQENAGDLFKPSLQPIKTQPGTDDKG